MPALITGRKLLFNLYSLKLSQKEKNATIQMDLHTPQTTTIDFPNTLFFLKKELPLIFNSKCYNYINADFETEVINTEIAHLFEHIMLTLLYEEKMKSIKGYVKYDGVTRWKKSKPFSYKIEISSGKNDEEIFSRALSKANRIINQITSDKTGDSSLPVLS